MTLVEQLKIKQGQRSQAEFARELGITEASLSLIYLGRREVGKKVARCIKRQYPDLVWALAEYLLSDRKEKPIETTSVTAE